MRFTEKGLRALTAGDKPRDILASNYRGLILRVSKARGDTRKVFRYRYWRGGVARYVTLGEYAPDDRAHLSLAQADSLRTDCRDAVAAGQDPAAVVAAYWAARAPKVPEVSSGGPTVAEVVNEFLTHYAEKERKRPEQARYLLDANVIPVMGSKPAADVRKRDIVTLLDGIVARGSPVVANRVQALLKQAFAVAADRDLIEATPTFPRKAIGGEEKGRTRILSDDEIALLWHGLDLLTPAGKRGKGISRPLALALKLQLVTAQRRGEIALAKWTDIAEETRTEAGKDPLKLSWWNIPETKNERPHVVPLPRLALDLLAELKALAGESAYWLPNAKDGDDVAADRERTITKAAREVRTRLLMAEWTPHDLRRTARTGLARLGVSDEVGERVLNHVAGDRMVAVYNQHRYLEEMRSALDKWSEHVEAVVAKPFEMPAGVLKSIKVKTNG